MPDQLPARPPALIEVESEGLTVLHWNGVGPFSFNRSRGKGLRSNGKSGLNRRMSNKELQNVEGQLTSPLDIPCSIFCGLSLLETIGERLYFLLRYSNKSVASARLRPSGSDPKGGRVKRPFARRPKQAM